MDEHIREVLQQQLRFAKERLAKAERRIQLYLHTVNADDSHTLAHEINDELCGSIEHLAAITQAIWRDQAPF